ncbi:MAG: 50S ribosomal protein L22 [Candidatus Omnitrophica bacterium]|nr:50S ribosomal protein L22 [Candidatus Omnitrophota bacterium]
MAKTKQNNQQDKETESKTGSSAKAVARYLRVSPRKIRLVIDSVRYKPAFRALGILANLPQKGARFTEKLLKSAIANAKDLGLDQSRLYISDIRADQAPTMKRFLSRSMGRADRILKRSSHLSLTLSEGERSFQTPGAVVETAQEEPKAKGKAKGKKVTKKTSKAKAAAGAAG